MAGANSNVRINPESGSGIILKEVSEVKIIHPELADDPDLVRTGLEVGIQVDSTDEIVLKTVWERGRHFPRPLYEKRVARAIGRATKLLSTIEDVEK